MNAAKELKERYTYKDYLTWPEDERWELIDGVAYNMSPAPLRIHQDLSLILTMEIANFLKQHPCKLYVAPFDVRLPDTNENEEDILNVVQPDLSVICDSDKLDEKGCLGAPDFIIEILSDSTAGKDLHEKMFLYEKHGVKEYWTVDVWSQTISIRTLEDGKYKRIKTYNSNDQLPCNVLKGLTIDLAKVFFE